MNDAEARERPRGKPIGSWTDKPPAMPTRRSDLLTNGRAPGWRELWLDRGLLLWIVLIALALYLIVVGAIALIPMPTPVPCEQYANYEIAHLPARCAAFYGLTSMGGAR